MQSVPGFKDNPPGSLFALDQGVYKVGCHVAAIPESLSIILGSYLEQDVSIQMLM